MSQIDLFYGSEYAKEILSGQFPQFSVGPTTIRPQISNQIRVFRTVFQANWSSAVKQIIQFHAL